MDTSLDFNAAEYKILIVDDVVSNVLLLKVLLKNLNYQIATANDGLQALSAVETEKPDLILLDVMMPGLNGFEVAEKLKENPETRDIPIIFLTALNATSDVVRGFKAGANDFISKPFHKEELLIRVSHQISSSGKPKSCSARYRDGINCTRSSRTTCARRSVRSKWF